GHGVVRNGSLRRVSSTSDLHSVLRPTSYQASSIHSRRRNSFMRPSMSSLNESPPPPPPPVLPPSSLQFSSKWNNRAVRENRLLSDLWLMSAATFRRLGKIEQAKGAIQEAEVKDEGNPAVWVQLGLYYIALGRIRDAIESFHKALFISADDITSTIHLSRIYLFPEEVSPSSPSSYSPKFSIPGSRNILTWKMWIWRLGCWSISPRVPRGTFPRHGISWERRMGSRAGKRRRGSV
ncbi:hypothetical protein VKT23_017986, partial [Stygiomarasmius scandens]